MQPEGQRAFAQALIRPEAEMPEGIIDPAGNPAPKRFAVYRNNVIVSLTEGLMATFASVAALVGEEFFKAMARAFVQENPPSTPLLMEYGRDFARFIDEFPQAGGLPFLADVARVDRAWLDAYHAADALPLEPSQLERIDQETLLGACFVGHPATRLVASRYPVAAIWHAGRSGEAAAGIDPELRQSALIVRPDTEVSVIALTAEQGAFFSAILDGHSLGDATEKAIAFDADFDLAKAFGLLIGSGAFVSILIKE